MNNGSKERSVFVVYITIFTKKYWSVIKCVTDLFYVFLKNQVFNASGLNLEKPENQLKCTLIA